MSKRLFSGVQPSGNLHIGNYLGAIKQWVELQDGSDAIFCIVDLHAITVPQDPAELRRKTLEVAKIYLASGIDPAKCKLFVQSHVREHTELAWILNTLTQNGDLTKMTQFRDKALVNFEEMSKALLYLSEEKTIKKNLETADYKVDDISEDLKNKLKKEFGVKTAEQLQEVFEIARKDTKEFGQIESMQIAFKTAGDIFNIFKKRFNESQVGLFAYPVLMAADILLYDTAVVPVGKDQMQHIELTRTLAERFNTRFDETFIIPEGKLSKEGALIMGLDDPTKKMSKSATSEYNYIALTDDAETVRRKVKKAVTDSGSEIVYSDEKPALKNLLNIYGLLANKKPEDVAGEYAGKGYADFKNDLAEVIVNFLTPFQERLNALEDEDVLQILRVGAEKAGALAEAKMKTVRERIGFIL